MIELESTMAEQQIKPIFYQMLKSIEFCHDHGIVHRDVKLENFLMECHDDGQIVIRLTDFGMACRFNLEYPPKHICGSLLTIAPEMLAGKSYGPKVDTWALGVILHELLSTQLPFYAENDKDFIYNIVNQKLEFSKQKYWEDVSSDAQDLVLKLLDKNPKTRLSMTEAMNHPWLKDIAQPGNGLHEKQSDTKNVVEVNNN